MPFDQPPSTATASSPTSTTRIVALLGREPNLTELGIFSVMWSEHCSYKSSRVHLKTLPTEGPRVLQGPGENAGAVDIGDGLAAVFKIESHNHPSFIEPYQGAATGVGGIIRDIFTMGARPIALLNALRFGPLERPQVRRTLEGVVAGIAGYGNSIGIPTIGGEVSFDESYTGNPLVNVFCLGIARADEIIKGVAQGLGNPVYYVGAKTGRDGIHGATMASAEFDEKLDEKRPAVQVGDPFMEKLLLEACLEVMKTDALVGIQDMGAAGLTCSTCEMGARGGVGIEIDVQDVPQRETGMTPYEIMLSESQERMLLVVKKGREAEVERIFEKWDLHAVHIGEVTGDGLLRVKDHGTVVAEIPNKALADEAPLYNRPTREPDYLREARDARPVVARAAGAAVAHAPDAARPPVDREQALDLSPVRSHGAHQHAGAARDGRGRHPREGHQSRAGDVGRRQRPVLLPRSVPRRAARGGRGRPQRRVRRRAADRRDQQPQFRQSREARGHVAARARPCSGIGAACRALEIPITGGNVSLYNETDGRAILPTPVLGVVGVIEDASSLGRAFAGGLQAPGSRLRRGGPTMPGARSRSREPSRHRPARREPRRARRQRVSARPARHDQRASRRAWIWRPSAGCSSSWSTPSPRACCCSAHDCAEGGLAVALAECCFDTGGGGAEVDVPPAGVDHGLIAEATLFGESASRVVVSVEERRADELLARARAAGVPAASDRPDRRHATRDARRTASRRSTWR